MEEIYVSPENLKTGYYRKLLKLIARDFGGGIIVDYSQKLVMKDTKMVVRQAKIGVYVPKRKKREAKSILRMLGFKIVHEEDAVGLFDESILMSMLIPLDDEEGVPVGVDLSGDHMVLLPMKRVLFYGLVDYRLPLYLSSFENNVCWIDGKGFRKPLEVGFEQVDEIPLKSMTDYALSELSRVIGALTVGERYASDILSLITSEDRLFEDVEVPLGGRETQALREVVESGLLSLEKGGLSGKVFVDVQNLGEPAVMSAIAAVLLGFSGLVIVNTDVWHPSILPIVNRREGIVWLSHNPAMQLVKEFEHRIFVEADYYVLSRTIQFEGEIREVRKRFIPIWKVYPQ